MNPWTSKNVTLAFAYLNKGMTLEEISASMGLPVEEIAAVVSDTDYYCRFNSPVPRNVLELIIQWYNDGRSLRNIASSTGLTPWKVRERILFPLIRRGELEPRTNFLTHCTRLPPRGKLSTFTVTKLIDYIEEARKMPEISTWPRKKLKLENYAMSAYGQGVPVAEIAAKCEASPADMYKWLYSMGCVGKAERIGRILDTPTEELRRNKKQWHRMDLVDALLAIRDGDMDYD